MSKRFLPCPRAHSPSSRRSIPALYVFSLAFGLRGLPTDPPLFAEVVRTVFAQRRKTLRNTLGVYPERETLSDRWDLSRRSEQLPSVILSVSPTILRRSGIRTRTMASYVVGDLQGCLEPCGGASTRWPSIPPGTGCGWWEIWSIEAPIPLGPCVFFARWARPQAVLGNHDLCLLALLLGAQPV